ncbi:MAG: polymer-forming cytoskeletal protein [Anaerolineae bacterium]
MREKSGGSPISDRIENIIGPTASFSGDLKCDGGVRIDGVFKGSVETMGNVIIGEAAKVVADITGRNISVAGAVRGNIKASGRLEILSTGQVWGDISVESFLIDEGGFFNGLSTMQGEMEPLLMEQASDAEKVE